MSRAITQCCGGFVCAQTEVHGFFMARWGRFGERAMIDIRLGCGRQLWGS